MLMKRIVTPIGLALALSALAPDTPDKDPAIGKEYKVPYRLTLTNHYLVRVRINGKGPFHFLVDTGAPSLYIATETAKKAGLIPAKKDYWTAVERLDLEGGATLKKIKGRVEDPFQLIGMNALGLPGVTIDGILGFTILARFRMEFDPTEDRMTWTRLDYEPKDPYVPKNIDDLKGSPEMQMMNALGPMMKFMAIFVGKQPEDILQNQGVLGLGLDADGATIKVATVLANSPAAKAGIEPGDVLVLLRDQPIKGLKAAHEAIGEIQAGEKVRLAVRRGDQVMNLSLTAAEGF